MASSSEPSRKRVREEEDDDESHRRRLVKEGTPPEEPKEVPTSPRRCHEPEEALSPQPDRRWRLSSWQSCMLLH
jgi:hypothetical protein